MSCNASSRRLESVVVQGQHDGHLLFPIPVTQPFQTTPTPDADQDLWLQRPRHADRVVQHLHFRRTPMPTPRSGIAAAVLGGKILIFGGEATDGTFDAAEVYDPQADSWTSATPLPTARHGLGAAAVEGRVYVIAGGPTPGGSVSALNEIFTP